MLVGPLPRLTYRYTLDLVLLIYLNDILKHTAKSVGLMGTTIRRRNIHYVIDILCMSYGDVIIKMGITTIINMYNCKYENNKN